VIARYHLRALGEEESAQYVRHRLEVCGLERPLPFDRAALRRVHAASGGVPRRINLLCDRALLGAYASGNGNVTRRIVDHAAAEVFPRAVRSGSVRTRSLLAAALALAAGAGLLKAATYMGDPSAAQRKLAGPASQAVPPASATLAAAAVPVPAPAPALPPAKPTLLRDEDDAWRELAQAWKLPPPDGDPCAALAREQVRCFSTKLSLPLIRQLARPGIVTLDAHTSQPSYAILIGLTDQTATLRAAGTEQTVTLSALADRWQGDFATLWRAPAGYVEKAKDGQGGPALEWVAVQLAAARGVPAPSGNVRLDPRLRADLRAFQVAQGLPVDGQAGPLTYMQLNRASGVPEPRLRTEP
jgi:general secretion pathway protein A